MGKRGAGKPGGGVAGSRLRVPPGTLESDSGLKATQFKGQRQEGDRLSMTPRPASHLEEGSEVRGQRQPPCAPLGDWRGRWDPARGDLDLPGFGTGGQGKPRPI